MIGLAISRGHGSYSVFGLVERYSEEELQLEYL